MNDGQFDPESDSSKDWFGVSENEAGLLRIGTILRIAAKWKPVLDSGSAPRSRSRYPCGDAVRHVTADEGGLARTDVHIRKKFEDWVIEL